MQGIKSLKKILVVDDDQAILDAIGQILESEGYSVHLLPYGEKIFENIGNFLPDLIILDIMLGPVDGSLLCSLINNTTGLRDIPVIMISGVPDMKYILRKTCPQSHFIEKPFEMDTLINTVRSELKD